MNTEKFAVTILRYYRESSSPPSSHNHQKLSSTATSSQHHQHCHHQHHKSIITITKSHAIHCHCRRHTQAPRKTNSTNDIDNEIATQVGINTEAEVMTTAVTMKLPQTPHWEDTPKQSAWEHDTEFHSTIHFTLNFSTRTHHHLSKQGQNFSIQSPGWDQLRWSVVDDNDDDNDGDKDTSVSMSKVRIRIINQ